jgi:hypothetical protein
MHAGHPDTDEIFTYLGKVAPIHFFLHVARSDLAEDILGQMCGDVYNCMIQETMIGLNDKVVVCTIRPQARARTKSIQPTLIDHISFSPIEVPAGALETAVTRLLKADRAPGETMLVIKAIMVSGRPEKYLTYEMPSEIPSASWVKLGELVWPNTAPTAHMLSMKPIPYL